jgi:predicted membrane protein
MDMVLFDLVMSLFYCFSGVLMLIGWLWKNLKEGSFIRRTATLLAIAALIALLILKPVIFLILFAICFLVFYMMMFWVTRDDRKQAKRRREFEEECYRKDAEYRQSRSYEKSSYERKNSNNTQTASDTATSSFFEGMSMDEAKKEFHRLIKIYHPDNKGGSLDMSQKITSEYERFRARHQS